MNEPTAATAANTTANTAATPAAGPADEGPPPAAMPLPAGAERRRGRNAAVPIAILAFVLASLALVLGVTLLHRTDEVTRRLDQVHEDDLLRDQRSTEREMRLAALEREWRQAQGDGDLSAPGTAVTAADVRHRREQLALIDIERLLEQVQLELRLGAVPQAAVEALSAVDTRLTRLGGRGAQQVQAALRRDLTRLRAAPDLDRVAIAAGLDPLLAAVDHWHASADPMHMSARPVAPAAVPPPAAPMVAPMAAPTNASTTLPIAPPTAPPTAPPPAGAATANAAGAGSAPATRPGAPATETVAARLRAWLAREFGDFMRIREVDTPDALLLAPAQQQILRDRFRLGVLDLRQAILARDERAVRAEAGALDALLEHYFDPNQAEVAAAQAQLRGVVARAVPAARANVDETLAAVRAAAAADERAATP